MADFPEIDIRSRVDLRSWLAANHATHGTAWMVIWKKHTPHYVPFGDLVTELLCWGWVDSVTGKVDADRARYRISPRNPKSAWSAVNKAKVAQARADGSMTPAGEALITTAKSNGMWEFLDDVERLEVPPDLAQALGAHRPAWEAYSRSVKRGMLETIKTAKRAETRAKRIADLVEDVTSGQLPRQFRR